MATTPGNKPQAHGPRTPPGSPCPGAAPKAYRWVGQEGCGPKGWWTSW